MSNELRYTLDTSKEQYTLQKCKQLDNRPLVCKIYDRGQSYNLSNTAVELRAFKPDGTFAIQDNNISISGNTITVNPIEIDIVRIAGVVKLELRLTKSGQSVSSFTFELVVLPSAIPSGTPESKNLITVLEELNNAITNGSTTLGEVQQALTDLNNLIISGGAVKTSDYNTDKNNLNKTIYTIQSNLSSTNSNVNLKADKEYVDSITQSIASGAPDETFDTLLDLQTKYPTGNSKNKIVASDGHIYNWSGSIWKDTGIQYQSTGIAKGSINIDKVNFMKKSKNLFDNSKELIGHGLNTSDGTQTVNSSMSVGDYIEVEPSTNYAYSVDYFNMCFYTQDKIFISGLTLSNNTSPGTIVTPSNCYYVRIAISKDNFVFQFEKGTVSTEYESYGSFIVETKNIPNDLILNKHIKDNELTLSKVNFMKKSKNLFDKNNCQDNLYIPQSGGNPRTSVDLTLSDYIAVVPSNSYTYNIGYFHLCYYDINKTYISGNVQSNRNCFTEITPNNCYYIRISVGIVDKENFQIELGTEFTQYENFGYLVENKNLENNSIDISKIESSLKNTILVPNIDLTNGFDSEFGGNTGKIIVNNVKINQKGKVNLRVKMASNSPSTKFLLLKMVDNSFMVQDIFTTSTSSGIQEIRTNLYANGTGDEYIGFYQSSDSNGFCYKGEVNIGGYSMSDTISNLSIGVSFSTTKYNDATFAICYIKEIFKFESRWLNKKMNCLGDSLTQGDITGNGGLGTPWTNYMQGLLGLNICRNYGICGTVLSGNWTNAMVNRFSSMDDDADLISVWGGTNDFCVGLALGTLGDTTNSTFYGSLDVLIKGLYSKYTNAEIFFITPPKINKPSLGETYTPNSAGHVLKDYRDAIINICDKYSIPVLDFYTYGGMSCYLDDGTYRPDKLHYSNAGYEKIAHKIAGFANKL